MMKRRAMASLLLALLLGGCAPGQSADIKIDPTQIQENQEVPRMTTQKTESSAELSQTQRDQARMGVLDFSVALFNACAQEEPEQLLISPVSVLSALAMTANGAQGETLGQMETAFGVPLALLTAYLEQWQGTLLDETALQSANAIWIRQEFAAQIQPQFLKGAQDGFDAQLFKAPFDDGAAAQINQWISEKTNGNVPQILDEIPQDAVLYLINALSFDAKWRQPYAAHQIRQGTFTNQDGTERTVTMLYGQQPYFLKCDFATGFLKPYQDDRYAFAALLPDESLSVWEMLKRLDGETLSALLDGAVQVAVETAIPKFTASCGVKLNQALEALGMTDAFDPEKADFSGMALPGTDPLYINRVLHQTHIALDAAGTKAGAATAVEMNVRAVMMAPAHQVYLDRPFVYMIVDLQTGLPVFLGVFAGTPQAQ